jgi:hypothetical protein
MDISKMTKREKARRIAVLKRTIWALTRIEGPMSGQRQADMYELEAWIVELGGNPRGPHSCQPN